MSRSNVAIAVFLTLAITCPASAIDPERINQIIIQGRFDSPQPKFTVVFSTKPQVDERKRLLTGITARQLANLKSNADQLVLQLHSKPASNSGRIDYFFGSKQDANMPWNDGREFDWKDWEQQPADIWDNVCIIPLPTKKTTRGPVAGIASVTIRFNSQLLYDSRKTQSYPNKRPLKVGLPARMMVIQRGKLPVLNLADRIRAFRNDYYELDEHPVLKLAYSDLAQTDRRKYANRGRNWCSEFCSYLYRENKINAPDPNAADVNWKVMREHFEKAGKVYPSREVASWTDQQKRERIKPGSFVSILTSAEGSTHSLMFTTWVNRPGAPLSQYTAVSGNNKGMVWAHSPLTLPTADKTAGMSSEQLAEYDQKVYFAVPNAAGK